MGAPTLTRVKTPHRPPPYVFSDDEIRRLFRVIDTQPLSEMSNRALVDPVLFRVFYGTGMRHSEALNLELADFDPARATLEVRDTKNHENRIVPVTRRLADTLEDYIAAAHPIPTPPTSCSTPATPPPRPTCPRFTTGSTVTWPTPTSLISGRPPHPFPAAWLRRPEPTPLGGQQSGPDGDAALSVRVHGPC